MAAFNSLWKPLLPLLCAFGVVTTTATAWGNPNDLERLVRKDGTSVVGVIIGFGQGSYRVRVGDGTVEVPAHEVRTIEAAGEQRPGESIQPPPVTKPADGSYTAIRTESLASAPSSSR